MESSDFELREDCAIFRHPDFPGAEIWILGDPSQEANEVKGIEIRGATEEQLPLLIDFVREMAPGMEPEIIP